MPPGTSSSTPPSQVDESHEDEEGPMIKERDTQFLRKAIDDLDDLHSDIRVCAHGLICRWQVAEDCMSQYVKKKKDRTELEELWRNIATAICMIRDAGDLLLSQRKPFSPEIKAGIEDEIEGFVALPLPEKGSNCGAVIDQSGTPDGSLERNHHRFTTTIAVVSLTVME